GKYKLEAEIGRGGFGRVYRAYDPTVGRSVAIKVLISDKNEDLLARFRREATATGKLRHKNIVTVYEYGEHENTPYLVMEYLEGEDLKAAIAAGHIASLVEKTSIMSQVAEGLQHAHHHGIVHRDVKPANVMVLSDATVKIMDFGIARVLSEFTTRLTRHGDVVGTLSYMAPEVFQGAEVDERCDIFSFGTIYYELVAGKHPFGTDEPARVIYNITSTQPPPVSTLAPDCPPALEQLIARAMHKDRELRYQTLEDLLFDLMPIRLQLQSIEAQNLIRKAETLVHDRQIREAQTVVRQVLQLDPNNTSARELRERINREIQMQATRERCDQLIASGTDLLQSLQYAKAAEAFETVLRFDPSNIQAQNLLEQVRTAAKKRERAEALLAQARRELETDQLTDAYRSILECLQYAPDSKEAAALLERIRGAIKIRERQRRLTEGLGRVQEMLRTSRPEPRIRQLMIEVASAIEQKRRRQQLLERMNAARNLTAEKKWADALSLLNRLLKDFPDEDEVRSLSAYAHEQLQLQRKAQDLERILRDARTANEHHDFERALDLLDEGLRTYPGESSLKTMLARTEELRTDYQRQIALRAARERATELAAANDFSAALAVIDSTAATWQSEELQELRRRIQTKREEFERAQAIATACASVKASLERQLFEEALTAAQQALARFPGEPGLTSLAGTAQARLAEQRRNARIKAILDEATTNAAEDRFSEALELLRRALADFAGEPSLTRLYERIQAQQEQFERQQAVARTAAALQDTIKKGDYEEAVRAGRVALTKFPGEPVLTRLVDAAEQSLLQQKRARRIASVHEQAKSLASAKDFQAALQLIRNSLRELGSEPSLEALAHSIDDLRQEHEEQEAIRAAVGDAKEMLGSKDYSGAVVLLEQALEKYRGERAIESLLAEAREQLALQRQSDAIDAILGKARELLQGREFQAALAMVRSGIKEYPDDSRLAAMAAEIKTVILEMEKQRAIRSTLDSAAALRDRGEFSKAAQLLEQGLLKAPGQTELQEELARLKKRIATQQQVNAVLDEVCELMSRGGFDEALDKVHRALILFPRELALSSLLEEVNAAQRSHALAAACHDVEALRSAGDLVAANRRVREVLAEFPDEPTVLALKSRIQSEMAEQQKRQIAASMTVEIRQLLDQQKVDDAIGKLENALRQFPGDSELAALLAYSNEIVAARRRADAISDLAKRAKALLQTGKPREAESLLKNAVRQYSDEEGFQPLLKRAKDEVAALEKREQAARAEHTTVISEAKPAVETRSAVRSDVRDRAAVPTPGPALGARVRNPQRLARAYAAAIGLILVLIIGGFLGWTLFRGPGGPDYRQQLTSAESLVKQRDFAKAIEVLQQIPSSSPVYKQARDLLTTARNEVEKQRNIEALIAQATELHKQKQYEKGLATIQKVLDADPSNQAAKSIRESIEKEIEIEKEIFTKKTDEEKIAFIRESVARAQELFNTGNFEEALTYVEAVLNRADDRTAANLKRRIVNQLEAAARMNSELIQWEQAKAAAVSARAPEFDPPRFAAAQRAEELALRQQNAKQFDQAARRFAEAAGLYRDAERTGLQAIAARRKETADQIQVERSQAEAAHTRYEQNLTKARGAEAEAKAADGFRTAVRLAQDAQAKYDRGDFVGARTQFDVASTAMSRAVDVATQAAAAAAAAAAAQAQAQRGMEAARTEMETAKRGVPAGDARASQEEARARQLVDAGKLADATAAYQSAASLFRDAARQRDNPPRGENEQQAIRTALDRYKAGYEREDINAIRAVFPNLGGMEETATRNNFGIARSIEMQLSVTGIQISGETATAAAQQRLNIRTTDNKTLNAQTSIVFNLRKRNGSWFIESIVR
ncbi:MAG: hypothetical protein DMG13_25090, partial [Acidobacteria bacterium]